MPRLPPPDGSSRGRSPVPASFRFSRWGLPFFLLAAVSLDGFLVWRHSRHGLLLSLHETDPVTLVYALGQGQRVLEARLLLPEETGNPTPLMVFQREGTTVLRLPYVRTDRTLRTHLAVRGQGTDLRLAVFDAATQTPARRSVFGFVGEELIEVPATREDRALMSALASVDDGGTLLYWDLYFLLRPAVALGLLIAAAAVYRRRETRRPVVNAPLLPWDGVNRRFTPSEILGGTSIPASRSPTPPYSPILK